MAVTAEVATLDGWVAAALTSAPSRAGLRVQGILAGQADRVLLHGDGSRNLGEAATAARYGGHDHQSLWCDARLHSNLTIAVAEVSRLHQGEMGIGVPIPPAYGVSP